MDQEIAGRIAEQLAEAGIKIPSPVVKLQYPIGAYLRWDVYPDRDGVVVFQTIGLAPPAPPSPNICMAQRCLDLMGYSQTEADGSVVVHVRDFVCWPEWKIGSEDQVWVVATARSDEPVYLTHVVQVPFVVPGRPPPSPFEVDLQIRIFSWDREGRPKPDVLFTWRAVLTGSFPSGDESLFGTSSV